MVFLIKGAPHINAYLGDGSAPVVDWTHPGSDDLQKESIKPMGDQKTSPLNSTTDISSNLVSFKDTAILGLCRLYWRTCFYLLLKRHEVARSVMKGQQKYKDMHVLTVLAKKGC